MYDYAGKLVLVTGASSGLGWQLARRYQEAGARVALLPGAWTGWNSLRAN